MSISGELEKHGEGRARRTAIVFSYAHWEGFVKQASVAYLMLVCYKTRPLSRLTGNFWALACRQELALGGGATKKIAPHIDIVRLLTDDVERAFSIDASSAIDTESNLNYAVFKNICESIGVDYDKKWKDEEPSMNDLFNYRCAIAHGELYTPDNKYALEVTKRVIEWIDSYATDIENSAIGNKYLRG